MDLAQWVEEAESLLRSDGLWPEQDEERARGVLEDAALGGPESLVRAMRALRRSERYTEASKGAGPDYFARGMRLALAC